MDCGGEIGNDCKSREHREEGESPSLTGAFFDQWHGSSLRHVAVQEDDLYVRVVFGF